MPRPRSGSTVPLPPLNLEAEEYVLGALMIGPGIIEAVSAIVGPGDFYRESHGRIYTAILAQYGAGQPFDVVSVGGRLEAEGALESVGGNDRLREIATLVPAAANAPHHARLVRETSVRRNLVAVGERIALSGREPAGSIPDLLSEAERLVFELSQSNGGERSDLTPASEIATETFRLLEELAASGRDIVGLRTGFAAIDKITSGFRPGQLVIAAGRPSMGKSAFALGSAVHAAVRDEVPVAVFSLEMSKVETMQRLLASEAMVNSANIQNGKLSGEEWGRIADASNRISKAPLWIDESGASTMTDIRSKLRRLALRERDLGLVVVDYVQLMAAGVKADGRNAELSLISRSMKLLAVELRVPIIMVSQLSRAVEDRHDKRPILSDLRDSGALEQDADVVLLLYRDEYYFPEETEAAGIAEVNVAKQRNGPVGMRKLAFRADYVKFTDLHQTRADGAVRPPV